MWKCVCDQENPDGGYYCIGCDRRRKATEGVPRKLRKVLDWVFNTIGVGLGALALAAFWPGFLAHRLGEKVYPGSNSSDHNRNATLFLLGVLANIVYVVSITIWLFGLFSTKG